VSQSAISGFGNLTIPKEAVPYGTVPSVYVNSLSPTAQGYAQNAKNYYVWYITYYTTYELQIIFDSKASSAPFPQWIILAVVIIAIASALAFVSSKRMRKNAAQDSSPVSAGTVLNRTW